MFPVEARSGYKGEDRDDQYSKQYQQQNNQDYRNNFFGDRIWLKTFGAAWRGHDLNGLQSPIYDTSPAG